MTTAPSKPTLPAQTVTIDMPDQVRPDWYRYFSGLVPLFDYVGTLQPLSDIVFPTVPPDPTKSNVTRTINVQSVSYQIALTDAGNIVAFTASSSVSLVIPLDSTTNFPVGTQIDVGQLGGGSVVFAPASGVTLTSLLGNKTTAGSGASATLVKVGANFWWLTGSLIA